MVKRSMAEVKLKIPLKENDVRKLKAGDVVKISGIIYTARDAAHKYLLEKASPETLPFNLAGSVLYHCGPVVEKVGDEWKIVAAGPTTSARLSAYEPEVIEKYGVRAVIGKGGMDRRTLDGMKEHGAVYLSAVGGAAVVIARTVKKVRAVYMLEEFGVPEAFWELEVEDFPAIVTMDANGNSIHEDVLKASKEIYKKLVRC